MSHAPNHTHGPLFRGEFRELQRDPTYTGPGASHPRNPMPFINLGVGPQVLAAARSGAATGLAIQPLHAPVAQRANQQRAEAAAKEREILREAAQLRSQEQARQRLGNLRKGRGRNPQSLASRLLRVLERADGWLATRELIARLDDPTYLPMTASRRVVRPSDVSANLTFLKRDGIVITRPLEGSTRLLEWRLAALEAGSTEAAA
jgi:hypothetical protein